MAHEIGHTFALDDCNGCDLGASVMATGWDPRNPPSPVNTGPTGCDTATAIDHDGYL